MRLIKEMDGGVALFVKTEVASSAEVEALVNKVVETYGRLDTAFNNAGIESPVAIIRLTKSAALDYAKSGIRVNAVSAGAIETAMLNRFTDGNPEAMAEFNPVGRIGKPEEIAEAVVWLCSNAASFVFQSLIGICT